MVTRLTMLSKLVIGLVGLVALATLGSGCTASVPSTLPTTMPDNVQVRTVHVELESGKTDVDLHYPTTTRPLPLIIVAHGFSRSKANMAGWGRILAAAGYMAAVPDLPAWADHARNGRFINELIEHLVASPPEGLKVDRDRVGLLGFSAGGLATLLAAADNPAVLVWVGLDPVDKNGQGAAAAPRLRCRVAILRAEPSSCNANGNAAGIERALKVTAFNDLDEPGRAGRVAGHGVAATLCTRWSGRLWRFGSARGSVGDCLAPWSSAPAIRSIPHRDRYASSKSSAGYRVSSRRSVNRASFG